MLLPRIFGKSTNEKLRPRERYSSVDCRREPEHAARCVFSNVGFVNDTVIFYEDPSNPLSFVGPSVKYTFPAHYFGIRGGTDDHHFVNVSKCQGPIPEKAIYADHAASFLIVPFWPQNQGHWLVDDLFASFSNMLELGMYVPNPQLVISKGCLDYFAREKTSDVEYCHDFFLRRTKGYSSQDPLFLTENPYSRESKAAKRNEHSKRAYENGDLIFQNLIGGHSTFALMKRGEKRSLHWNLFRRHFLKKSGLSEPRLSRQQITVVQKKGRRNILNFPDVLRATRGYGVDVVVYDPTVQTWEQQLEIMLRTTVLVTVPGGISFLAGFLQSSSVGLFFDAWDFHANRSYPLEGYWWEGLSAFRFLTYDYDASEASFPAGATDPSLLDHEMKVTAGLPTDRQLTVVDLHSEAKTLLYRFFTDIHVDLERYQKTLCEALAIAEANMRWKKSYDYKACARARGLVKQ